MRHGLVGQHRASAPASPRLSCGCVSRLVAQSNNAARIGPRIGQPERRPQATRRQQRDASTEKDRDNCQLHNIHESCGKKAAGQGATAKEPNIPAILCPQRCHRCGGISTYEINASVNPREERPGEDIHAPASRPRRRTRFPRHLVGPSAEQDRVDPSVHFVPVNGWVAHDPVDLAARASDVTVEARSYPVSHQAHALTCLSVCPTPELSPCRSQRTLYRLHQHHLQRNGKQGGQWDMPIALSRPIEDGPVCQPESRWPPGKSSSTCVHADTAYQSCWASATMMPSGPRM